MEGALVALTRVVVSTYKTLTWELNEPSDLSRQSTCKVLTQLIDQFSTNSKSTLPLLHPGECMQIMALVGRSLQIMCDGSGIDEAISVSGELHIQCARHVLFVRLDSGLRVGGYSTIRDVL